MLPEGSRGKIRPSQTMRSYGVLAFRFELDEIPYSSYSSPMSHPVRKGVEAARAELPAILADAQRGRPTVITRHGKPVAAVVPADRAGGRGQLPLLALAGSGRGMWGRSSAATLRRLREEWGR